jgi:hypothetical protein
MVSMARIRQRKLGHRSSLLEDFVTERSALESDRRNADEGRRMRAAVMGCHGAPQLTRWLNVAGEHVAILVVRGDDGWPARRWQFGRRCHAGAEQGGIGGRRP